MREALQETLRESGLEAGQLGAEHLLESKVEARTHVLLEGVFVE